MYTSGDHSTTSVSIRYLLTQYLSIVYSLVVTDIYLVLTLYYEYYLAISTTHYVDVIECEHECAYEHTVDHGQHVTIPLELKLILIGSHIINGSIKGTHVAITMVPPPPTLYMYMMVISILLLIYVCPPVQAVSVTTSLRLHVGS